MYIFYKNLIVLHHNDNNFLFYLTSTVAHNCHNIKKDLLTKKKDLFTQKKGLLTYAKQTQGN